MQTILRLMNLVFEQMSNNNEFFSRANHESKNRNSKKINVKTFKEQQEKPLASSLCD